MMRVLLSVGLLAGVVRGKQQGVVLNAKCRTIASKPRFSLWNSLTIAAVTHLRSFRTGLLILYTHIMSG